jgi:hypothetical protein
VEAVSVSDGDSNRMILQGGKDFPTLEEARKKAEVMGNWLMFQHHPLTSIFLAPKPVWNPQVIIPMFDAGLAS